MTSSQIQVGIIEPLSGPLSFIGQPWVQAVQSVFADANAQGGICGRKLAWTIRDDQFDAQQGAQDCRDLVENTKVWSLVTSWSVFTVDACIPYLASKNMDWFFTDGASDAQYKSPYIFPAGVLCRNLGHSISTTMFQKTGAKKVGVIYINNDVGRACDAATHDAATQYGATVTDDKAVSPTDPVTNFQSDLLQMQSHGDDVIIVHGSPTELINTLKAAKNNGYKPPKGYWASGGAAIDLTIQNLKDCCASYIEGVISNGPLRLPSSNTPEIQKMVATITKYYPDADLGTFTIGGYVQATQLVAAMRAVGGNLTRAALAQMLRSRSWCSNIAPCITFSPPSQSGGNGSPENEFVTYQVKNLRWTEISGWQKDNY